MRIRFSDRIKAFFSSDEETFWFNHFTDEEKALRHMDVWELAKVINEARVRNLAGEAEKLIVAEHMLNVRLAKIQAKASWGSGILGFTGAIIGASLSIALASITQTNNNEVQAHQENTNTEQAIYAPEKKILKSIAKSIENTPSTPSTNIPAVKETIKNNPSNTETNENDAPANP